MPSRGEKKLHYIANTATENIVLVCLFVPRSEASVAGEVAVAGSEHDPAASRVSRPARALHLTGPSEQPVSKECLVLKVVTRSVMISCCLTVLQSSVYVICDTCGGERGVSVTECPPPAATRSPPA